MHSRKPKRPERALQHTAANNRHRACRDLQAQPFVCIGDRISLENRGNCAYRLA